MNYLAHAYLSFDVPDVLVGNLISDFIKGKKKQEYPPTIGVGITLHRAIDTFTDEHPITKEAKQFFRQAYGLYAGPLVDIAYDHFLANDPSIFAKEAELLTFAARTYQQAAAREAIFPSAFARLFPYMRSQNWMYGYRFHEGISNSFHGLARRASYMPDPATAVDIFHTQYKGLQDCYSRFFPELKNFARQELDRLRPAADPSGGRKI